MKRVGSLLIIGALMLSACGAGGQTTNRESERLTNVSNGAKTSTALYLTNFPPTSTPEPIDTSTPKPTNTPKPTTTRTRTPRTSIITTATQGQATNTRAPAATQPQPQPTQPLPTQAPQATATEAAPPPTTAPAFTVINITSPISAGSNANVTIQTAAGASCFLGYTTPSGTVSEAQGLGAATADGSGICSWTWRIGASTNPGTGSLGITANGATQYYPIEIQ